MAQQSEGTSDAAQGKTGSTGEDQENELEAEQESAAAMDADVPQPPGADQTTEGQPS
jgi:hypothetical protein